jgi:hypothetical protein
VPLLRAIVPRQRAFAADIKVINECLDGLIASARASSEQLDEETLQNRDYSKVRAEPSVIKLRLSKLHLLLPQQAVGFGCLPALACQQSYGVCCRPAPR